MEGLDRAWTPNGLVEAGGFSTSSGKESNVMREAAKDVNAYLAAAPVEQRALLEKLRKTIRAAAPEATKAISYGMPTFKYLGGLVAFAAFKNHCSLFPMSYAVLEAHKQELGPHWTSTGTVQFTLENPLPATLVRKIVKARIAENEERAKEKKAHGRKKG